jgi:hypothetical protein
MDAITPSQQERIEMELVLQSGIFQRAPLLANFFRYICERYFEGRTDQIKEYSIALEAFGRSDGFDPKKDSIVRVEAHRLRKRLNDYYKGPGASHPVHIAIPQGQYIPQFLVCQSNGEDSFNQSPELESVELAHPDGEFSTVQLTRRRGNLHPLPLAVLSSGVARRHSRKSLFTISALLLCLVLVAAALHAWRLPRAKTIEAQKPADEKWLGQATQPVSAEFRMLAGYHGPAFMDRQGHTWNADAYYTGGQSTPIPPEHFIEGQPDPRLLKAQRSGIFHYDIPLRQGSYELHLYFAETEYGYGNPRGGGESTRIFQVSINGGSVIKQIDPLADAGAPNRLNERIFKDISPANDGKLHINFSQLTGLGILNAIEIVPSAPGRIQPVRIVAQDSPITDADGQIWSADEYFCGGALVLRRNSIITAGQRALYQGERYGNFSYRIPLAPGKYRLKLHFAETWFGTPESNEPASGSRVFNVFANGVALLRNFEIAKEAGGINRSVDKVFPHLEPNAQGILLLDFVPVKNYAEVNAIEVVETE